MGMVVVPLILQLLKLCVIGFLLSIQGSAGNNISLPPTNFAEIPPVEGMPSSFDQMSPSSGSSPRSESPLNGSSNIQPPVALPPVTPHPMPPITMGHTPAYVPSSPIATPFNNTAPSPLSFRHEAPFTSHVPIVPPPDNLAPPPQIPQGLAPPVPSSNPARNTSVGRTPVSVPALAPEVNLPQNSSIISPRAPGSAPSSVDQRNTTVNGAPILEPVAPVASPPSIAVMNKPLTHPMTPTVLPPVSPVPVESPIRKMTRNAPKSHPVVPSESPSTFAGQNTSQAPNTPPRIHWRNDGVPVAAPPEKTPKRSSPVNVSPIKAPSTHKGMRHSNDALVPPLSSPNYPSNNKYKAPSSSPSMSLSHAPKKNTSHALAPSYHIPSLAPRQRGPVVPPSFLPGNMRTHYAPPPLNPAPTSHHPIIKPKPALPPAPSPSMILSPGRTKISPSGSSSSLRSPSLPLPAPIHTLPPPPPNEDCSTTVCTDPYTNTPPGSPCGCVLPMQVALSLSVALYTFFPLVSELAQEIATGVFLKQSQVRIMGANAANQEPQKTIVLIDLVPLGVRFDNTTAYLTFERFWHKQVVIKASFFGDYEVLYVHYPGLPPSPPLPPSSISIIDDGPYGGNENNARTIKPLGVDVPRHHRKGLGGGTIAIIALSATVALVLCSAVAWILLLKRRDRVSQTTPSPRPLPPSVGKPAGATGSMMGSGLSSASLSFASSIATFTGSAKTFSISDIERATNNFDSSRILGEGGFGRVYSGILEDGTKVAVKVLKRDDQQGGREFLAEVEMLSRLHHRNLVKLIGICTEDRARSLVYELIPNGSVESHLHGVDKESAPLDWDARIKIALGAARGLAYLHEDSSPRVIHRDFKASNILLEHDFTPKVSDFGLARTAMDEENRHISTRVMGTFGYVAPEYAMTGHLLVKSDVYSYGVVLLELLTGRKPVDMSQPPGQENLVAWARPLLTSKEGLEMIIDPSLGSNVPYDSVGKVAAIASMCVQPEVSNRPFMGEVVQALKLVCNECDESKEVGSGTSSRAFSIDMDPEASVGSDPFQNETSVPNYDSEPDIERGLPVSNLFSASQSARYSRHESGSLRRYSSSGLLRAGRGRRLWQRARQLMRGSMSEHTIMFRSQAGSH